MDKDTKIIAIGLVAMLTLGVGSGMTVYASGTSVRVYEAKKNLDVLNGTQRFKSNNIANKDNLTKRSKADHKKTHKGKSKRHGKQNEMSKNKKHDSSKVKKEDINKLLAYAEKYKGVPYRFGGTTPNGFDCSGYLSYVFQNSLGMTLPRSADAQYAMGYAVKRSELEPGDLVFFTTYEAGVSHSGIYVGNGQFISATTSSGVAIANMTTGYWSDRYIGAKRIL